MPVARDAGHVTKNFPRAIKVPINQTREQLPAHEESLALTARGAAASWRR